jgi:hypothetical protein
MCRRPSRRALLKQSAAVAAAYPFLAAGLRAGEKGGAADTTIPSDWRPDTSGANPPTLNPWRLEPVDLRRFMRLGVEHIYHGAVDRRRGCLPFLTFNLTDPPTWAKHDYWSSPHMVGRFLDALAVTADLIDLRADEEVVNGLRTLLHRSLDNPTGLPFYAFPGPDGKRTADMHNCREVLLGLVGLWRWRGCERSATLARQLVRKIEEVTRKTGSFPGPTLDENGWEAPQSGKLNETSGRLIGALVAYYRATKDETAIDLAKRFAEINIRETFTPEGELTPDAGTHLHSTEGTTTALLDLGILAGEDRYFQAARRVYDVGLNRWRTSYGWAKESRRVNQPVRGEANNTGDFIEAALLLAQAGHPEYSRDAERFIRNGLLASQVVATDWIVQSSEPDTDEYVYSDIRRRARGAFAFTTPNGYHSYNTDLMGGALQSLAQAYRQIVSRDTAGVHVNMLFSCDNPWLNVTSSVPQTGRMDIHVRQATPLYVRLAHDIVRRDVSLQVNGKQRPTDWKSSELVVGGTAPADTVTIHFSLPKRRTDEPAPGYEPSQVGWLGDTIVAMQPRQGKIALY